MSETNEEKTPQQIFVAKLGLFRVIEKFCGAAFMLLLAIAIGHRWGESFGTSIGAVFCAFFAIILFIQAHNGLKAARRARASAER